MGFEGIFEALREREEQETREEGPTYSYESTAPALESGKLFVVSVGGSVIVKNKINTGLLGKLAHSLAELEKEGYRFVLVAGGGKTARNYVAAGNALGADNYALDELGIQASRLNAFLLIQAFENAHPKVLTDIHQAKAVLEAGKTPVYGGLIPGFTTDTVAALLAETLKATFINLSNVAGVYNADPEVDPKAKMYSHLTHAELLKIIARSTSLGAKPSQNVVLDLPCALILNRSKIKTMVMLASDIENIESAVRGQEFEGTLIESSAEEIESA